MLREILDYLLTFKPLPDAMLARLDREDAEALREVAAVTQRNRKWRLTSRDILKVSQMLNRSEATDAVFADIVSQARSIIGADVSYISLNDHDSELTNILVTSGVVTEAFRTIQIPIGVGVLGMVASGGRPAWTSDHATDANVTHVDEVDRAVRGEGIRAILGTPLEIGGRTIGALMVADRQPRNYTHDEVGALELLGSITSVALENTRRLERHHAFAQRQSDQIAALHRLADVDHALLTLLTDRADAAALADTLGRHLGREVVAWEGDEAPAGVTEPVWARPDGRIVGGLGLRTGVADDFAREALTRGATVLGALILATESVYQASSRKVEDLVHAVALGSAGAEEIRRLRQLTGVNLDRPDKVRFIAVSDPEEVLTSRTLDELLSGSAAITRHDQHYCFLHQAKSPGDLDALLDVARRRHLAVAAVALGEDPAAAHSTVMDYLAAARALEIFGRVVGEGDFGALGLILGANPRALAALTERLTPLIEYDAAHGAELERTAYEFFAHGHSASAAAKTLYVHVNTVRQRLERITALLGEGWSTGAAALDVHVALRVRRLGL